MSKHSELTTSDAHVPFRWVWADSVARLAQAVTVDDINKIGHQQDDGLGNPTVWVLTQVTPTWKQMGVPSTLISAGAGTKSILLNGNGNTGVGNYSITGGNNSKGYGNYGIALGQQAYAYGNYTVALGSYARPNGNYATVIGGLSGVADGNYAAVIGGLSGVADGVYAAVIGGLSGAANGAYAGILAGKACTAGADFSMAGGNTADAHSRAMFARSAGSGVSGSRSQFGLLHAYRLVTHSTTAWFPLFLDGASAQLTFPVNSEVWAFLIYIAGTTQNNTKTFAFKIEGVAKNDNVGATTLVASTVTTLYNADDVSFAARVSIDDPNDALQIEVSDSDAASDAVNWTAFILLTEVGYT